MELLICNPSEVVNSTLEGDLSLPQQICSCSQIGMQLIVLTTAVKLAGCHLKLRYAFRV